MYLYYIHIYIYISLSLSLSLSPLSLSLCGFKKVWKMLFVFELCCLLSAVADQFKPGFGQCWT